MNANLIELLQTAFPTGVVETEPRGDDRPDAIKVSAPASSFDVFQDVMDDLVSQGLLDPTDTFVVFHEI